ncbi:MAG: response regulator transcription factor [Bacteroidota bacterium]
MKKKRVLLVDDHPIFAKSVSYFLTRQCQVDAKWISTPKVALDILRNETIDLVILDIEMPELDGVSLLKLIREKHGKLPVLMVTMQEEPQYVLRCIEYGVTGYILKTADPLDLIRAVESTLENKSYYCRGVLSILATQYQKKEEMISERQEQVLKLTAAEFTIKEIADHLNISTHTVITHRKNLMQKLSVKSQVGLAVFAVINGYYVG